MLFITIKTDVAVAEPHYIRYFETTMEFIFLNNKMNTVILDNFIKSLWKQSNFNKACTELGPTKN
jgi:hypothetical protein